MTDHTKTHCLAVPRMLSWSRHVRSTSVGNEPSWFS
jgi:hypothetical protein